MAVGHIGPGALRTATIRGALAAYFLFPAQVTCLFIVWMVSNSSITFTGGFYLRDGEGLVLCVCHRYLSYERQKSYNLRVRSKLLEKVREGSGGVVLCTMRREVKGGLVSNRAD